MKKIYLLAFLVAAPFMTAFAQGNTKPQDQTKVVFTFKPQDDMFYMRESSDNQREWKRLSDFVDKYKSVIRGGETKVYVTSYSTTMASAPSNRLLAKTMANRVKTELILKNGLKEEDFKTKNKAEAYDGLNSAVVVEITIPAKEAQVVEQKPQPKPEPKPEPKPQPKPEPAPAPAPAPEPAPAVKTRGDFSRWALGINVGMPFFEGDFSSYRAHRNRDFYFGWMAGVQATYQLSPAFGLSLTADYGQNNAGSPLYGKRYLMSSQGIVYHVPQDGITTKKWMDLYQKTQMFSAGLHLDINLNRIFTRRPNLVNVILSPGVYGQYFNSEILNKDDEKKYVTEELSKNWSLGLGGDLAVRFRVSPVVDLQLKGTARWINDKLFDNIDNQIKAKDNWMWGGQAGILFKLGGKERTNLFYKDTTK